MWAVSYKALKQSEGREILLFEAGISWMTLEQIKLIFISDWISKCIELEKLNATLIDRDNMNGDIIQLLLPSTSV